MHGHRAYLRRRMAVCAVFETTGALTPMRIRTDEGWKPITHVKRGNVPRMIRGIATDVYAVWVEGYESELYFDARAGVWFSREEVKEEGTDGIHQN